VSGDTSLKGIGHPVERLHQAFAHPIPEGTMQDLDRTTSLVADPATGLTPADLRRAALAVCGYATDAADARDLLSALGLLDELGERSSLAS
jgi:hypothetical protein